MSSPLKQNTATIQELLNTINSLPEAGTDLPELTNEGSASDLLSGKQLIDSDGNVVDGTIATKTASNLTASGATVTVPAGYYASQATKSVSTGSAKTPATTITKNPTISVDSSGKITASVSGTQNVTPTVTAGYVSSGTAGIITVSGSATKQLTTQAAKTITPTKSSQTAVASGVYTTGAVTVGAIPSQYITTTDATAAAGEIFSGETAYVNGNKITGTFSIDSELTTQDNLISRIQTALQNKAAATGEDVTSETNAYTTKLATLETAISALETELQGKASGGSGGGSVETVNVTINSLSGTTTWYYTDANMELQSFTGSKNITALKNTIIAYKEIYYGLLDVQGGCTAVVSGMSNGSVQVYDTCTITFNASVDGG